MKSIPLILFFRLFKGCKSIISLGSVSGAIAYLFSKVFKLNLFLYQYEPHSEYALDGEIWKKNSFSFKIMNELEYQSAQKAKVISTGTRHMIERLIKWKSPARIYKIPSVVDENSFYFQHEQRKIIRKELHLSENSHLIIYPGKFGDLYYSKEIGNLFKIINDRIDNCFFLVLTLTDIELAENILSEIGLPQDKYMVTSTPYNKMPNYLSAADLGIVGYPPLPSKKFCSSIKVGEFLCTGLPYLICKGISEDDEFALQNNVGIVVEDFNEKSILNQIDNIKTYLTEDVLDRFDRYRELGIQYRGFINLNRQFHKAIKTLVSN